MVKRQPPEEQGDAQLNFPQIIDSFLVAPGEKRFQENGKAEEERNEDHARSSEPSPDARSALASAKMAHRKIDSDHCAHYENAGYAVAHDGSGRR